MSEFIQKFILKNTKSIQYIVNEKLAKRGGRVGKFFRWMEIGERSYGQHVIPKWFRFWNTMMLTFGFRMNWGRAHLTKIFTKEREIFMTGYALLFVMYAWLYRKNRIRPLFVYRDYHLHDYDNPDVFTKKFGQYIPFNTINYKVSAHFLEINRIFHFEMMKRVYRINNI